MNGILPQFSKKHWGDIASVNNNKKNLDYYFIVKCMTDALFAFIGYNMPSNNFSVLYLLNTQTRLIGMSLPNSTYLENDPSRRKYG